MKFAVVVTILYSLNLLAADSGLKKPEKKDKTLHKPVCLEIFPDYIEERFGKENISYTTYSKLLNSREVYVQKGQRLEDIIKQDEYSYGEIQRGVQLTKNLNALKSDTIAESRVINLPFCANDVVFNNLMPIRTPASTNSEEKKIEPLPYFLDN